MPTLTRACSVDDEARRASGVGEPTICRAEAGPRLSGRGVARRAAPRAAMRRVEASTSSTPRSYPGSWRSRADCARPTSPRTSRRRRCSWPTALARGCRAGAARPVGPPTCANLAVSQFRRRLVELRATARLAGRRQPPVELSQAGEEFWAAVRSLPHGRPRPRRSASSTTCRWPNRRDPRHQRRHRQAAPEPGTPRPGRLGATRRRSVTDLDTLARAATQELLERRPPTCGRVRRLRRIRPRRTTAKLAAVAAAVGLAVGAAAPRTAGAAHRARATPGTPQRRPARAVGPCRRLRRGMARDQRWQPGGPARGRRGARAVPVHLRGTSSSRRRRARISAVSRATGNKRRLADCLDDICLAAPSPSGRDRLDRREHLGSSP